MSSTRTAAPSATPTRPRYPPAIRIRSPIISANFPREPVTNSEYEDATSDRIRPGAGRRRLRPTSGGSAGARQSNVHLVAHGLHELPEQYRAHRRENAGGVLRYAARRADRS